jgi:hypothetical protein
MTGARADRLAVLALESPNGQAPHAEADRLTADLLQAGHHVLGSADVAARLTVGNQSAGRDWAAALLKEIDAGRAALTRLDQALAATIARRVGNELANGGGGTGGPEPLVEWALLQRQLAMTGSDTSQAARWLDAAIAFGPDIELDPFRHPRVESDAFLRRRAVRRNEPAGQMSIATTPASAEVAVDGVRRCESPCTTMLVPGRHWARITLPAHAAATIDFEVAPEKTTSLKLGLVGAYSGATLQAISAMLTDPVRRAEGASALEPMARFLDVDHVIAILPWGDQTRIMVAPSPPGQARLGPVVAPADVSAAAIERLHAARRNESDAAKTSKPWYGSPVTWIAVGATVAAMAVGGYFILRPSDSSHQGTLTVTSPPPPAP